MSKEGEKPRPEPDKSQHLKKSENEMIIKAIESKNSVVF